jgi:hypothetical protein
MKTVLDHATFWENETACLLRLLKEWQPSKPGLSEKEYEVELDGWLSTKLPDVPIVRQYGIAKGDADLVIHDSWVIELKLAFTAERLTDFDRCIGQLERYRQKWVEKERGKVFLVIVGKSESEFRDMIHKAVKSLNQHYISDDYFHIVEKLG